MTLARFLIAAWLFSLLSSSGVNADTLATYQFINTTADFSFPGGQSATIGITGTFTVDTSIACASPCPALTGAVVATDIQLTGLPDYLTDFSGNDFSGTFNTVLYSFWGSNPPQFMATQCGPCGGGIQPSFLITPNGQPYALDWIIL
jgi:hypothetical protein